jgi:T5orf172 domain
MLAGSIYILINPSLKGLVKIGKTDRSPEERAGELSSTGLPTPFFVAYEHRVGDYHAAERAIHEQLEPHRFSKDREVFKLTVKEAIKHVAEVCSQFPEEFPETVSAETLHHELQSRDVGSKAHFGLRFTKYVRVRCSNCSTEYSVTMRRYELGAACPQCLGYQHVVVEW